MELIQKYVHLYKFNNKNISQMNNRELNAYQITWAILEPVKGIITKKDQRFGFSKNRDNSSLIAFGATGEAAETKVKSLAGKLSKEYNVFYITDKQFGMTSNVKSFKDVATTKQLSEMFQIK